MKTLTEEPETQFATAEVGLIIDERWDDLTLSIQLQGIYAT